MATLNLPQSFRDSYRRFIDYPENLIPSSTSTYRSTLASYKSRLDDAQSDLCLVEGEDDIENDFEIRIRDLDTASGKGPSIAFNPFHQLTSNGSGG